MKAQTLYRDKPRVSFIHTLTTFIKFVWIDNILQYLVLEGAKMEWEMGSKITVTPHDLLTAKKNLA